MMRLHSDLVQLCNAAIDKPLDQTTTQWDPRCAVGVVLAAGGYPDSYHKGDKISGIHQALAEDQKLFHAGTLNKAGDIVTAGGRVLCACALGNDVISAQQSAYKLAGHISWNNLYFRTDIAYRAIAREQTKNH